MFDFVHVSLAHADHNKIGEDVKEEYRHTDEEKSRNIRIDEIGELSSNKTKVCVVNKMMYSQ